MSRSWGFSSRVGGSILGLVVRPTKGRERGRARGRGQRREGAAAWALVAGGSQGEREKGAAKKSKREREIE